MPTYYINPFYEISIILALAFTLGLVGKYLKQPLIIMFLIAGVLAGPSCLKIIHNYENIKLFANIGISILLFIVGLKLDFHLIKTTGFVTLVTGLFQIFFTFLASFIICWILDFNLISNLYISLALTFSSTIIVIKILSDKNEIDSLYGKITVGVLILQDIFAILILIVLPTLKMNLYYSDILKGLIWTGVKGICIIGILLLCVVYILPSMLRKLAQSQELLLLFAIAWAVLWSSICAQFGFSKEMGAFSAGIALAYTDYKDTIVSKLATLRDFLLLFFFIDLGAKLNIFQINLESLCVVLILSLLVILLKPLTIMLPLGYLGYKRRISLFTGISLAQISEFSLIIVSLGIELGHISEYVLHIATLVAIISILISTYLQLNSNAIYNKFSHYLKIFEFNMSSSKEDSIQMIEPVDVIIFGLGRYGMNIISHLIRRNKKIMGVDFNPQSLELCKQRGIKVVYGDMGDSELYDLLPIHKSKWVVSTIRNAEQNIMLLKILKHQKKINARIAIAANTDEEAQIYENFGVDVIFRLFEDAAEQAADSLTHAIEIVQFNSQWPITFKEIRIPSGSIFGGKKLKEIPLRAFTKTSIIALSRGGRVYYEPDSDFVVYPNDRLIIVGTPVEILRAENLLKEKYQVAEEEEQIKEFSITELDVCKYKNICGKSLKEVQFRQTYGVTVIIREGEQIILPDPNERILEKDKLIVIGLKDIIERL